MNDIEGGGFREPLNLLCHTKAFADSISEGNDDNSPVTRENNKNLESCSSLINLTNNELSEWMTVHRGIMIYLRGYQNFRYAASFFGDVLTPPYTCKCLKSSFNPILGLLYLRPINSILQVSQGIQICSFSVNGLGVHNW